MTTFKLIFKTNLTFKKYKKKKTACIYILYKGVANLRLKNDV